MRWTDPVDGRPRRHARVWLDASTWRAALASPSDAHGLEALDRWIGAGRALVGRRREAAMPNGAPSPVPLGVALPDRTRTAIVVDAAAIVRVAPPLTLAEVVAPAPDTWRAALRDLDARGAAAGVAFHVYGSLAWQAISGEPYVTPRSDVDLLWTAAASAIDRVLQLLLRWEAESGLRADGECLLPDGSAVAWRELVNRPRCVLVKHQDGVSLAASPLDYRAARDAAEAS